MFDSKYLNVGIVHQCEGPWPGIEYEIDDKDVEEVMMECIEEGEAVSLEAALKEMDEYFDMHVEHDRDEYVKLKEDFVKLTKDVDGKYYVWSAEYDVNICFMKD